MYVALVDLAYSAPQFAETAVVAALDIALASRDLPDTEKLRFSQRKLDLLEDLGTEIDRSFIHIMGN